MVFIWILLGLIYFISNTIITLSWTVSEKCKAAEIVTLLLAGLPIMILVIVFSLVAGVIEVFRK